MKFSTALVCALLAPPAVDDNDEAASSVAAESLDCVLDGCDGGEPETAAENGPEPEFAPEPELEPAGPSAEELKLKGRGLVASGEYTEGIAVLEQAYQLAPGDHIIAYDIASAAQKSGQCGKMRQHLEHFIKYADPNEFPNKIDKASRALNSGACVTAANYEIDDAVIAGASKVPVAVAVDDGARLVGGGVVMVGVGILAFGAGIALVAIGMREIQSSAGQAIVPDPKYRSYVIGGGVTGPIGVALVAGGAVMIARGNQPSYVTVTPTGLTIRF